MPRSSVHDSQLWEGCDRQSDSITERVSLLSALLAADHTQVDVAPRRAVRRALSVNAETLQTVFALIADEMNESRTLFAHARDDDRRCSVLGYGVMRDGSTYVTLHDPKLVCDDGLVTLDLSAFAKAFGSVRRPTRAEEAVDEANGALSQTERPR